MRSRARGHEAPEAAGALETRAGKLGFKSNGKPGEGGLGFTQVSSAAFWRISHRKAGVEVGEHVVGCFGSPGKTLWGPGLRQ